MLLSWFSATAGYVVSSLSSSKELLSSGLSSASGLELYYLNSH
jgi:hypothetical protein